MILYYNNEYTTGIVLSGGGITLYAQTYIHYIMIVSSVGVYNITK
jgi:hypothetical protein